MTLYAFDDIDDALDATVAFLWPFDLGRWARLAVVMFFVGAVGGGVNPFGFNFGGGGPSPGGQGATPGVPGGPSGIPGGLGANVVLIVAAVVAVLLVVFLVFLLVGSVMEFVFVESLRRESVSIRRYWGAHWRRGVRLFGFRLLLSVLTLLLVGVPVLLALWPLLTGNAGFSIGLLLLLVPYFVVVAILSGLVNGFTTVFVVPVMLLEERGVVAGWRRFWATMRRQWKQYGVYTVMGFVLQIATGIVTIVAFLVLAVVLLIPFGVVGVLGFLLTGVSSILGWVVVGIVALLYVLSLVVVGLFVAVPVQTFLRYYALFVLGDSDADLDVIPDRRRAVRSGD